MSNTRKHKSSKRTQQVDPARLAEAASQLVLAYVEPGPVSKRGAIQSEAWRRLREAANLPADEKREMKREQKRKARAVRRHKEHPYSRSKIEEWFSIGFRKGLGLED